MFQKPNIKGLIIFLMACSFLKKFKPYVIIDLLNNVMFSSELLSYSRYNYARQGHCTVRMISHITLFVSMSKLTTHQPNVLLSVTDRVL